MSEGKAEILRMFQLALLVTVTWVLAMKGWAKQFQSHNLYSSNQPFGG
jgi:hypothetical protein